MTMPTEHESNIDMDDILIVDDETANLKLLSEILVKEGYRVRPANKPQLAIDSAMAQPPKLILLDVRMPEMDGFEVCRRLKQDDRTRDTPIIFVSALREAEEKVAGFEAGGVDFISKPFDDLEILARVRTHVNLRNLQLSMEEQVRKRTEEVFASEARFRATFDQAAVGIAHVSPEGRFLRLNGRFCDILGYDRVEIQKLSFPDITHPDDLDAVKEQLDRLLNDEIKTFSVEKRYLKKTGDPLWCSKTVSLVHDKVGQPDWFVVVLQDITVQKEAERGLRKSEQLARSLLNATTDLTQLIDEDGIILDLNDAMAESLGGTREELIGSNVFDQLPGPIAESRREVLKRARDEHRVFRYVDRMRPNSVLDVGIYPIKTPEGEKKRLVVFAHDITENEKVLQALQASEAKFRSLVENIPDVIWTTDSTGKTVYISDNVQEIFGFSQEEVYALSNLWVERIHPDDVDRVMEEFARLFQTGEMFDVEYRIRHKDGHWIWLHDRSMSRYQKDGVSYADGIFSDITELKEAQSESLKLRLEMAHLNRVMTMNELAASLAHELNQPLGAIANNASAGKFLNSQDVEDREDLNEILEDIARDAQRAGQIIGKIRGVMQRHESVYATLDINELLDEVVSLYKNSFALDQISVLLEKDLDISLVKGDRVRLQQVLMNLIANAMDAMANSPKKVLKFQTAQSEDVVSVSVRDTGKGIEKGSIEDIFDAFYTTKREGMGIGLRLCRSIVEEHGGQICVENNDDSGATFYFTLSALSEEDGNELA